MVPTRAGGDPRLDNMGIQEAAEEYIVRSLKKGPLQREELAQGMWYNYCSRLTTAFLALMPGGDGTLRGHANAVYDSVSDVVKASIQVVVSLF